MKKPSVDIILPCYNPEKEWANNVVRSFDKIILDAKNFTPNLIIVNDGSTNGISQNDINFIKDKITNFKWISYSQNKGKGFALRKGVSESEGDYILFTDIDFPYQHKSVIGVINSLINDKADILAGERSNNYYGHTPFIRKIISKFLKIVVKKLLKIKVSDTQCGLKGINKNAKEAFLSTSINRYLFDLEFLWLAGKKYKIEPFPVLLKDNIVFSKMNIKILITEGTNFIKFFIKTLK